MQNGPAFGKVVFIIKKEIETDFKETVGSRIPDGMEVCYAFQEVDSLPAGFSVPEGRIKPWGTAHAVLCAKPFIEEPFAVINADDYYGIHGYQAMAQFLMKEVFFRQSKICNGRIPSWKYCDRQRICIQRNL